MKPLLVLLFCLACVIAHSQQDRQDSVIKNLLREKLKWNNNPMTFKYDSRTKALPFLSRDSTGSLLPGIHRLPQDGMICYVPDTKDIAAIPNVYKGKVRVPFTGNPPRIPNPYQIQTFQFPSKE